MKTIKLKNFLTTSLLLVGLGTIQLSFAEISIIVHPGNTSAADAKIMKRIFLGKAKTFSGGGNAIPIELTEGNTVRTTFNGEFLGKSDAQMKSYWGRLIFTGKATAPVQASSDEEMLKIVSSNPDYVGYIDSSKVTDAVKVVHTF